MRDGWPVWETRARTTMTSLIERSLSSPCSLGFARVAMRGDSVTSFVSKNGPATGTGASAAGAVATARTTGGQATGADVRTGPAEVLLVESCTRTGLLTTAGTAARRGGRAGV